MGFKGRALIWLHKLDDGCEYKIFFRSGQYHPQIYDDINEAVGFYADEEFHRYLKNMKPGDWIRFTVKWEMMYDCWTDYYSGGRECDVMTHFWHDKTLRRGHYKERYRST